MVQASPEQDGSILGNESPVEGATKDEKSVLTISEREERKLGAGRRRKKARRKARKKLRKEQAAVISHSRNWLRRSRPQQHRILLWSNLPWQARPA